MPELPDIVLYLGAIDRVAKGHRLEKLRIVSPFVLRTFEPASEAFEGRMLHAVSRLGKRFVFDFGDGLFAVTHLMIAGRWCWSNKPSEKTPAKIGLASFCFDNGTLHLVESSQQKRASIHLVQGVDALAAFDRKSLDVLSATTDAFAAVLRSENHTLKRALTDPRLFDGIGNAYSDEILHAAQLSPVKTTNRLADEEIARLHDQAKKQLTGWIKLLQHEFRTKFPGPGDVTAFRPDFAVHGKFDQPCPVCGTKVQRIRYAENECNYCPRCQTGGKLLADRSMSRLLKGDWPKSIDELEAQRD